MRQKCWLCSFFLTGTLLLWSLVSHGATADTQLINHSLRIHPGRCSCGFGLNYYLYFSTYYTEYTYQANEELAPLPPGSDFSHWSYLLLEDASTSVAVTFAKLDLPAFNDLDGNGLSDFLDLDQAASAVTHGTYEIDWGGGTLTAVWSRAAGSTLGALDLTLNDTILGPIGPFHHSFELVEYSGTLTYTPGSNSVAGNLTLMQAGNTNTQIQGVLQFSKSSTNRYNSLVVRGGTLTSTESGPLGLVESVITRDLTKPTRYFASVQLGADAFDSWILAINDLNDSNHNGIPDFSDDPGPPRRPSLELITFAGNLHLTIKGEAGRTCLVQEAVSPMASDWTTVRTVPMKHDSESVALPFPPEQAKFWRAIVQ